MTKFTAKNHPFKTLQKFCAMTRFILEKMYELANVETKFEEWSLCYTPADLAYDSSLRVK